MELNEQTLRAASQPRGKDALSFCDGLIVAAALKAKVAVSYSEDRQDNLRIEGALTIVNPFLIFATQTGKE